MEKTTQEISLSKKQLELLSLIIKDKEELQKLANVISIREKEVVSLILDFSNIDAEKVESVKAENDKLIVTLK